MQKRRTQHFKTTLAISGIASCLLLFALAVARKYLETDSLGFFVNCTFSVLCAAAISFLVFSFVPYFHGDKRWYSISALLTVAFFIGAGMIWKTPGMGLVL